MFCKTAFVLAKQSFDKRRVKKSAPPQCLRRKNVPQKRPSFSPQPGGDRHWKTLLLTANNFGRQPCSANFLQQVLAHEALQFHVLSKRGRKFHEFVIKERKRSLHRRSHTRLVTTSEQVIGQPKLCVHVEHAVQRIGGIGASQLFRKDNLCIVTTQ